MYCEEARLKICLAHGAQGEVCTDHYFPWSLSRNLEPIP